MSSDREPKYRALDMTLRAGGLHGSMGRVASAADNDAMESYFALLQKNVLDRRRRDSREQRHPAILTRIERGYSDGDDESPSASSPDTDRNDRQHCNNHLNERVKETRFSPNVCSHESMQPSHWSLHAYPHEVTNPRPRYPKTLNSTGRHLPSQSVSP